MRILSELRWYWSTMFVASNAHDAYICNRTQVILALVLVSITLDSAEQSVGRRKSIMLGVVYTFIYIPAFSSCATTRLYHENMTRAFNH